MKLVKAAKKQKQPEQKPMQKLISISLYYEPSKHPHGTVTEHLGKELDQGWKIEEIHQVIGVTKRYFTHIPSSGVRTTHPIEGAVAGWLFVLLEKKP